MARRKKSAADEVPGVVILAGLAVAFFQKFWPYILAVVGLAVLIRYVILPAFRDKSDVFPAADRAQSRARFTPIMRQKVRSDGDVELVVDWPETFLEIKRAIDAGDYDFARLWLQKYAYTLPNADVPQETRDQFKRLMTAFAERDPLYKAILPQVLCQVAAQPGMLQTAIYPLLQNYEQETLRYVLYFAETLGDIKRERKGRSYRLWPSEQTAPETALRASSSPNPRAATDKCCFPS